MDLGERKIYLVIGGVVTFCDANFDDESRRPALFLQGEVSPNTILARTD